jgi:hypothetical protein
MMVNGQPCTVVSESASAVTAPPGQAQTESAAKMSTRDGQILDLNGQPFFIKGINYFGFETGNTFLDGYWSGGTHVACANHREEGHPRPQARQGEAGNWMRGI